VVPKKCQQTFSVFVPDAKKIGADIGMCLPLQLFVQDLGF